MTSRRVRTIELLTAGELARSDLAREEARAGRAADSQNRWIGALSSLIPQAVGAGEKIYGAAEEDAVNDATAFAAQHADVADQEEANSLLDANADMKPAEGDDWLTSLGNKLTAPIKAKAKATAATALSSSAKANTEKRAAQAAEQAKAAAATTAAARSKADEAAYRAGRDTIGDNRAQEDREERSLPRRRADTQAAAAAAMGPRGSGRSLSRSQLEESAASVGLDPDAMLGAIDDDETQRLQGVAKEKRGRAQQVFENNLATRKQTAAEAAATARAEGEEAKADAKVDAAKDGKQLDPATLKEFAHVTNTLASIPKLRALKEKIKTGQVEGAAQRAGKSLFDMPDYQEFTSRAFILKKLAARAIEGGRLTDNDMVLYDQYLSNPAMDDGEFSRIVDVLEETLQSGLDEETGALADGGYRVPPRYRPAPKRPASSGDPEFDSLPGGG